MQREPLRGMAPAQARGEVAVDLHGMQSRHALEQRVGQRRETGTDLDDRLAFARSDRLDDRVHDRSIDQEVLPEALARAMALSRPHPRSESPCDRVAPPSVTTALPDE